MTLKQDEMYGSTFVVHHETEKALLVSETGDEKLAKWIPKSKIQRSVPDPKSPHTEEITMPEWLAKAKEFI